MGVRRIGMMPPSENTFGKRSISLQGPGGGWDAGQTRVATARIAWQTRAKKKVNIIKIAALY